MIPQWAVYTSYDMSDGILVLPFSVLEAGTEFYDVRTGVTLIRASFVSGSANSSPQLINTVTVLTPSHFSDSTHHYLSINGKHIIGYFVIIPSSEIVYDTDIYIKNSSVARLFAITPTLDQ